MDDDNRRREAPHEERVEMHTLRGYEKIAEEMEFHRMPIAVGFLLEDNGNRKKVTMMQENTCR